MQSTLTFPTLLACKGVSFSFRSFIRNVESVVPKRSRQRENNKLEEQKQKRRSWCRGEKVRNEQTQEIQGTYYSFRLLSMVDTGADATHRKGRTGYLSLPPEIRGQILEQVMITKWVWPCRGQKAQEDWQQDFEIVVTALRQAWKNVLRSPFHLDMKLLALWEIMDSYSAIVNAECPAVCTTPLDLTPQFLSVCRTAYEEGHAMFYSQNTFYLPHGPLSHTRDYFDKLRPENKRLIRKMVLEISLWDLDLTAFDDIEAQLRAKDVVKGQLPPDRSVKNWVPPIVYNIISTWRSKLAWLRDWTWLEEITFCSYLFWPMVPYIASQPAITPHGFLVKIRGKILKRVLKGIGPKEPHLPLLDCYSECSKFFAGWMRYAESVIWVLIEAMIRGVGWKCSKAMIRRLANDEKYIAERRRKAERRLEESVAENDLAPAAV